MLKEQPSCFQGMLTIHPEAAELLQKPIEIPSQAAQPLLRQAAFAV
jgi:hypothetical protein